MKKLFVLAATTLLLSACNAEEEPEKVEEIETEEKESEAEVKKEKREQKMSTFSNKGNRDREDKTSVNVNKREDDQEEQDNEDNKESDEIVIKKYTDEEMMEMNDRFYEWAIERAEIGNLAVTQMYFTHGAAGFGDWYAVTPQGEVQVQDLNNPGHSHFDLHALGGVAFYAPVSEDYGEDSDAPPFVTATGYSDRAVPNTDIHKYMLVDNGVVYELVDKMENVGFTTGFGEYDDDGTIGSYKPAHHFKVSKDKDAQEEWQRIPRDYQ